MANDELRVHLLPEPGLPIKLGDPKHPWDSVDVVNAINALNLNLGALRDLLFARTAPGSFSVGGTGFGQLLGIKTLTEETTIAAAATTDTTIQFPAGSLGLGVSVRVTVIIPTAATFDVGIAGATTRYGTGIAVAAGTTSASPGTTNPSIYAAGTAIRFTPNATPGAATGKVRVTLHYLDLTAPTS